MEYMSTFPFLVQDSIVLGSSTLFMLEQKDFFFFLSYRRLLIKMKSMCWFMFSHSGLTIYLFILNKIFEDEVAFWSAPAYLLSVSLCAC